MTDTASSYLHFTAADEGLHPGTDNVLWQESVLLHWYDRRQGIGGWHRIGHEANNQGGRAAIWSYLFDRSGWQYRRCGEVPLTATDRYDSGFAAGAALKFAYQNDVATWTINEGPLNAELECRNLFPIVDPFPKSDLLAARRFASHFEVAGRVTGHVTYEGRRVAVEGYGYRDHSWGARDWQNGMPNHRWFTGNLGGELSFAAITAQAPTGRLTRVGYVHYKGQTIMAEAVDVVTYMEPDGTTHRGGELTLELPGKDVVQVRFRTRAGVLFQRGSVVMVEHICDAEGHGMQGYCDAEISSNPRLGKGEVLLALNAVTTDGFSKYAPMAFPF
jgi:hypothetical protein